MLDLQSPALQQDAFLSCQGAITHTRILLLLTRSKLIEKPTGVPMFELATCRLQQSTLHCDAVHDQP